MTALIEEAEQVIVDEWGTLNTAASPSKLPKGHSPNNQNVWMDEKPGSVITSMGYSKLGTLPSDNPPTFLLNFFKTSDGSSKLIVSDGVTVWWTTDYTTYTQITTGLSEYFQLRGMVIRDKVWLTNGSDPVMTWDGSTLATLDGTAGTPNVPKGKFISYHDERVWMYGIDGDLSAARFSALADSTGAEITPDDADAWPADNEIQISEGDADRGTGIFILRGYLYCSKQYSMWRITGYDEYNYSRVKTRSSTGTRFQESIQIRDNFAEFIGVDGLYVFDGEESVRVSDIVDPASSEEGVFAFRNLQQSLLNNQFWNVSEATDFALGTVPANLVTTDDRLTLVPADNAQADFAAGTHDDTTDSENAGYLQLARVNSGAYGSLLSTGKSSSMTGYTSQVGDVAFITDGNTSNWAGHLNNVSSGSFSWGVDLGEAFYVSRIVIKSFYAECQSDGSSSVYIAALRIESSSDGSSWTDRGSVLSQAPAVVYYYAGTGSPVMFPNTSDWESRAATDLTLDITTTNARYWRLYCVANKAYYLLKEIEIYGAAYETDGKFISRSLDFGTAPASYGTLAAAIVSNGEAYQFFTQSSTDNSTWDSEANVANGAAITSASKRYLRWGVYLYSSTGVYTPVIDKVYVGSTYISEIHNTGGDIFQWGAFQVSQFKAGQTVTAYYRAAATSVGVASESWTAIVPGAFPSADLTDVYIQIKLELSTIDATQAPYVDSFTVNWILSSGVGVNTLQNVASIVILNRYWLTAATLGAEENDIIIVRGKSTFNSPWHKKDFKVLSFCRFQDYYIAGSSEDGSIYRLEYGYSKNGSAMDSYYETADFSKDGFMLKGRELLVDTERSGSYNLSIGWSTDEGLTYTEKSIDLTRDSGDSTSFTKRLNINFMSEGIRFRVRINGADQPFCVNGITCYYRVSPQRGSIE